MAYGDDITEVAEADTGYYTASTVRVSNPVDCGDADGQGGTYIPPGEPVHPVDSALQIQYRIGDSSAIINGLTVTGALMVNGDTSLVLVYANVKPNSIQVVKDQVPLPIGLTGQYSYTVIYGTTFSTIYFEVPVGTNELYNITALINA